MTDPLLFALLVLAAGCWLWLLTVFVVCVLGGLLEEFSILPRGDW